MISLRLDIQLVQQCAEICRCIPPLPALREFVCCANGVDDLDASVRKDLADLDASH
jgi:hypothetical protein